MSGEGGKKRKSARVPVQFNATVFKDNREYPGTVLNLSADGLFLRTQQLFDSNDPLKITFQLPGSKSPLQINARVVWGGSIEGSSARTFGLGLHFEKLSPDVQHEIQAFIRSLLKT